MLNRDDVKRWVVCNAGVTNPYKKYWSASVTLGYDINEEGKTIEEAYNKLTDFIMESEYYCNRVLKIIKSGN